MSFRLRDELTRNLAELRHEPSNKRVRALLGDKAVIDSTRAVLVWEPRRVVPSYAVPVGDVLGELVAENSGAPAASPEPAGVRMPELTDLPVLDPRIPFAAHTTEGKAVAVQARDGAARGAGFLPADGDLRDHVILDFAGFDVWYEEDEPVVGHPRDPFHRIDVLRSSRPVRIELDGQVIAESSRAHLLFETMLPVRYYFHREDVRTDLKPGSRRSYCAYKGQASYWSPEVRGRYVDGLGWSYEAPLHDAEQVAGMIAFYTEHADLVLDGEHQERPVTPWS
jgi:uncharacterized protein (DUF427 family)